MFMSDQGDNRVLGRIGARVISMEEVEYVNGAGNGAFKTLVCTAVTATGTVTGPGDGDGCSDTDSDHP
jgi:hypothetical protein